MKSRGGPSRGLRAGIVGAGFIGRVHARSARVAGARVAAVAASTPRRSAEARRELGAEHDFAGAEELIASDLVDVVHICTPNDLHVPLALAALDAGKHVVCEKPIALDADGAMELVSAAASTGLVATVPFVYRYYPTVREARARLGSGVSGGARLIHGGYLQDWLLEAEDDNWRVDSGSGGPSRAFADIGSLVRPGRVRQRGADRRADRAHRDRASRAAPLAAALVRSRRDRRGTEGGRHRGHRDGSVRDGERSRGIGRHLPGQRRPKHSVVRDLDRQRDARLRPGAPRGAVGAEANVAE